MAITAKKPTWHLTDVNYALVEAKRPPMYTAMKYWGKKPHNIWAEFIESYCPPGGVVLDPFGGSAIAGFEAIKHGRKAICFDLNPLTSFLVKTMCSSFNSDEFIAAYNEVFNAIENDAVYQRHFYKDCDDGQALIYNYRWDGGNLVKLAIETPSGKRKLINADAKDKKLADTMSALKIPFWYPKDDFPNTPSITHKFIKDIGGNSFRHLWTRRNIYILAKIFDAILKQPNLTIRDQLIFGFLQTLHLTSKMVVPRDTKSGRDFSGSWGRADYMVRRRSMEQNPLVVFRRSCVDKQSALSALKDAYNSIPPCSKISEVEKGKKVKPLADLNYGIVDISDIHIHLKPKSVDFIITDPPYAGLVRYLDLSLVWLVWLKHIDKKYDPDLRSEITIKKGQIDRQEYSRRLENAFKQMNRVLKDDGRLVVTFHHKQIKEWNELMRAIRLTGFDIEKITHQYNRRSGEANVANPYGTSGADFYIRCVKNLKANPLSTALDLRQLVIQSAISTIAIRNEKTPYSFIVPGIMPAVINAGFWGPGQYQAEISRVLNEEEGPGKIFIRTQNKDSMAGDYWWFNDPSQHINYPDLPLKDRVDETIIAILRRNVSVRFDDVLAEIFRSFPNGLTPDPRSITKVLSKYSYKSADRWKISPSAAQIGTVHTEVIRQLLAIGRKVGQEVYVGKREQPESCKDGSMLRSHSDFPDLSILSGSYDSERRSRLEMIDTIWLDGKTVTCIFEVENSTDFMSAIQRGSNLHFSVPKFMVIPSKRESELLSKSDPLFKQSFMTNSWRYILIPDVARLFCFSTPTITELNRISKVLKT